jgi:hypothetical protein
LSGQTEKNDAGEREESAAIMSFAAADFHWESLRDPTIYG